MEVLSHSTSPAGPYRRQAAYAEHWHSGPSAGFIMSLRALSAMLLFVAVAIPPLSAQTPACTGECRAPVKQDPSSRAAVANVFSQVSDHPVAFSDLPPAYHQSRNRKIRIHGKTIDYVASLSQTYITNVGRQPIAGIYAISYVAKAKDPTRPVMFVFNGGPGSASIWLHMGAIGPRRVVLDREVNPSNTPPFGLRDNPYSVLDVADLVFIDPVGTGFSQAVGHARNSDFYGVDADAESVARFIEDWLTQNNRWNSPKYVIGESYGSIRAAVLPRALMGGVTYSGVMRGITLDGVVMLGTTLNTGVAPGTPGVPDAALASALDLPGMVMTARYHRLRPSSTVSAEAAYAQAVQFAHHEYASALRSLDKGELPAGAQADMAKKLEEFTSIPAARWLAGKLRLSLRDFRREVLGATALEVGSYDSRYTMPVATLPADPVADDPAMSRYVPGFISAFQQMLTTDLGVRLPGPYNSITWSGVSDEWNFQRLGMDLHGNYTADLALAMRRTPHLRLMVASGLYDLVTSPAAAEDQILRSAIPKERLELHRYESGHMLYLGDTAAQFADDVRSFIRKGSDTR